MTITKEALEKIKVFEGLRLESYLDIVGVPTIGFGSTKGVKLGQKITTDQAEELLKQDLLPCETAVTKLTNGKLNPNQFSACCDFCFNLGIGAFSRSTLLKLINEGKFSEAAEEFQQWDHAGNRVVACLLVRRLWEKNLFLSVVGLI